jgi:hypothetical protein
MKEDHLQYYRDALRDLENGLYVLFGRDDHFHTFLDGLSAEDYDKFEAYGDEVVKRLRKFIAERTPGDG